MSEYIYATDEHEGHWLTGEEIVRCRDCTHYGCEDGLCDRVGSFPEWHACVEPKGFCAWGERE